MSIVEEIRQTNEFFNMMDRLILPTDEELNYLMSQLSKGTNVALDKIRAFLPDCHSYIKERAFETFKNAVDRTSDSSSVINRVKTIGWGRGVLPKQFNLISLNFFADRKEEVPSSGMLSYLTGPSTVTKTIRSNVQISEISESTKGTLKMIHLAWHENGRTCEKLTSTLAENHVVACYEGTSNLPLLEQVCNWDPSQYVEPPKEAIEPWLPIAAKVAGGLFGAFALYKTVQNLRAEGYANKARAAIWAVAGIAALVFSNRV